MSYQEVSGQALRFIDERGSDCVGVIDSEEKMAAAMLYAMLCNEGAL